MQDMCINVSCFVGNNYASMFSVDLNKPTDRIGYRDICGPLELPFDSIPYGSISILS